MIDSLGGEDISENVYAEEGTRAHNLAEIEASRTFGLRTMEQYHVAKTAWIEVALQHGDDIEEMERHVRTYITMIQDIMAGIPYSVVRLEQGVQTGVSGCWGTADTIIVSPSRMHVIDFKYGQGVVVRAENNPQLKLYAVGALETYGDVLGVTETVGMSICQPRAGGMSHYSMASDDLRAWRDNEVVPIAQETQQPDARFGPSEDACRWCPAAGICKPRATYVAQQDFGNPDLMDAEELAEAFRLLDDLRGWCNAVEAEALHQAYSEGVPLPGLKVVLSGGKRSIPDPPEAIKALVAAGYSLEQVARANVRTISDLERLVGKKKLPEILGDLLYKSPGKPALVNENDGRPAISPTTEAQKDFEVSPDE